MKDKEKQLVNNILTYNPYNLTYTMCLGTLTYCKGYTNQRAIPPATPTTPTNTVKVGHTEQSEVGQQTTANSQHTQPINP